MTWLDRYARRRSVSAGLAIGAVSVVGGVTDLVQSKANRTMDLLLIPVGIVIGTGLAVFGGRRLQPSDRAETLTILGWVFVCLAGLMAGIALVVPLLAPAVKLEAGHRWLAGLIGVVSGSLGLFLVREARWKPGAKRREPES